MRTQKHQLFIKLFGFFKVLNLLKIITVIAHITKTVKAIIIPLEAA